MFKTSIASAMLVLFAGSALASHPKAVVAVTGSGTNIVTSSVAAGSYVNGAGSRVSRAFNTQTASAYVGGSGSFSAKPDNALVSIADCEAPKKVHGIRSVGDVGSFGGTTATGHGTASNVSTGAGTGAAQAVGMSFSQIAGKTTLNSPNLDLTAEGTAFSGVTTNTGVVGSNGTGASDGVISSAFKSNAHGTLFAFNYNGTAGDVKSVTTNSFTRAGGIPQITTWCGADVCTTGQSTAVNAVVDGGATANANGKINANINVKQ